MDTSLEEVDERFYVRRVGLQVYGVHLVFSEILFQFVLLLQAPLFIGKSYLFT